ncbi:MAG: hypothetical protein ACRBFS_14225 [Aureispira sp.]
MGTAVGLACTCSTKELRAWSTQSHDRTVLTTKGSNAATGK